MEMLASYLELEQHTPSDMVSYLYIYFFSYKLPGGA